MNPTTTRKLIGGLSTLFGLWWIWSIVLPAANDRLTHEITFWDILWLIGIIPLIAIPGVLAIVFGIRFFQNMSERNVKRVVALFSIFSVFFLLNIVTIFFADHVLEEKIFTIFLFPFSVIAFCSYLYIVSLLLCHLTQDERPVASFATPGALTVLAWLLWILLTELLGELIDAYIPIKEGYTHIHEAPWEAISFIVPVVVAFVCYKVAASLLIKEQETAS